MYVLLFPLAATTVLPFELALLSIICFRELWVAGSEEEVFSTLISGASRAITLSQIEDSCQFYYAKIIIQIFELIQIYFNPFSQCT